MQQDESIEMYGENVDEIQESNLSFVMAIIGGLLTSVVCALLWGYISYISDYQIGWMSIGVGFIVGSTVRYLGKGVHTRLGLVGALFSLLACVAGNLLTVCMYISAQEGISFLQLLYFLNLEIIIELLIETFQPMDLLFYGIALFEGYKFSFVQLKNKNL